MGCSLPAPGRPPPELRRPPAGVAPCEQQSGRVPLPVPAPSSLPGEPASAWQHLPLRKSVIRAAAATEPALALGRGEEVPQVGLEIATTLTARESTAPPKEESVPATRVVGRGGRGTAGQSEHNREHQEQGGQAAGAAAPLLGRVHLSGHLPLGPEARALVHEAVAMHKARFEPNVGPALLPERCSAWRPVAAPSWLVRRQDHRRCRPATSARCGGPTMCPAAQVPPGGSRGDNGSHGCLRTGRERRTHPVACPRGSGRTSVGSRRVGACRPRRRPRPGCCRSLSAARTVGPKRNDTHGRAVGEQLGRDLRLELPGDVPLNTAFTIEGRRLPC